MFGLLSRGGIYIVFVIGIFLTWLIKHYSKQEHSEIQLPDTETSTEDDFIAALSEKDWHLRLWGAENLAKNASEAAIPALVKTLQDTDPDVREASAQALGKLGSNASIAVIPLLQARQLEIREAVVKVLVSITDEFALEAISQAMLEDASAWVRQPAAEAISQQKNPQFHAVLVKALSDKHFGVYEAAKAGLLALNSPEAHAAIAANPYVDEDDEGSEVDEDLD